ncbi:hypothetical protein Trydic_g7260 [Trypoxylus dichotomus]
MGDKLIKVLYYADDATLFADSEDGFQRLLQAFNIEAQKLNLEISTSEAKSMVAQFTFLGTKVSPYGNLKESVRHQINKAARISGALRNIIRKNNCITTTRMENQHPDDLQGDYQNVERTVGPQCYKNENEKKRIKLGETCY